MYPVDSMEGSSNAVKKLSIWLIIQGIAFVLMALLPTLLEKWFTLDIGKLGISELAEIVFTFIWAVAGVITFEQVRYNPKTKFFFYLTIAGLVIFSFGVGIHIVGNQLNDHLFELEGINSGRSKDTAYFYDEVLGHYLIIIGYLAFATAFVLEQINYVCHIYVYKIPLIIVGAVNGFVLGLFAIEGQVVTIVVVYSLLMLAYTTKHIVRKNLRLDSPICFYYFEVVLFVTLLVLLGWGMINGGFPQFSEIGVI